MRKPRIYLETTVFNRYFEPERDNHAATRQMFNEITSGRFEAFTSVYVVEELSDAAESKREKMLALIPQCGITLLEESAEAETLAAAYVTHEILSERHFYDRIHIACASVNNMDMIISLNFSHINRPKTKTLTEAVNKLYGYGGIYIGSPMEVIEHDEPF